MSETDDLLRAVTRRHFFRQAGFGIGASALTALLERAALCARSAPRRAPHFAPKAKSVIYLFMAGAPSQLDLFDYKPKLSQFDGQHIPDEFVKGERFAFIKGEPKLLGSPYTFERHGGSGAEISSLLPHTAEIADDIAIVRSIHTTQFNHAPAQIFMNTGHQIIGRPSMGSWLTYGLGSECATCPASSCCSRERTSPTAASPVGAAASFPRSTRAWSSAPRAIRSSSSRIPRGVSHEERRALARHAARPEPRPSQGGRRSRDRDAHRVLRDGLPDADAACPS